MKVRAKKLQNIINHQCELFSTKLKPQNIIVFNHNNLVSNSIIDECLNKLYLTLERWHGINVTKTKKSLNTFREYFTMAKCWFDQTKKHLLAPVFWIKLFLHLSQFTKTAASQFFTNNNYSNLASLYSRNLEFQIISGIFNGKLRFAGTKSQPLIPCGILKDCDPMKRYLINLDSTLNTSELKKNGKNINAMQLLELVNKQLTNLTNNSGEMFMQSLQTEYISNNSNISDHINISNTSIPTTPVSNMSMEYNSYHSSSIVPVSEQRYTPLNSLNSLTNINYTPINVFNFNNENDAENEYEYEYQYNNQPQIQMYNSDNSNSPNFNNSNTPNFNNLNTPNFNNYDYNSNVNTNSNVSSNVNSNHCCVCCGCYEVNNNNNNPFFSMI